jgi:O-antigen biosynthesis protein
MKKEFENNNSGDARGTSMLPPRSTLVSTADQPVPELSSLSISAHASGGASPERIESEIERYERLQLLREIDRLHRALDELRAQSESMKVEDGLRADSHRRVLKEYSDKWAHIQRVHHDIAHQSHMHVYKANVFKDLLLGLKADIQVVSDTLRTAVADFDAISIESARAATTLNAVLDSKSWKYSAPLRGFLAHFADKKFQEPSKVDENLVARLSAINHRRHVELVAGLAERCVSAESIDKFVQASAYELAIRPAVPSIEWLESRRATPIVSIVILQYMKSDLTLNCVRSILKFTDPAKVEIVVVDNGSDVQHVERLRREFDDLIEMVVVGENRYFGEGNNIGVEASRGKYVAIMNNDVVVTTGWLEPLLYQLETEGTGAVGPCFLYPDQRVQECGGFISPDGKVEQRHKGAQEAILPSRPFYCDYVSAALVVLRRADFIRIGGFDLRYEPAYYEDVDLCLKLATLGLRTVCVPLVKIFHNENATSADPALGLKLHNIVSINAAKFDARWGEWLRSERQVKPPMFVQETAAHNVTSVSKAEVGPAKPSAMIYTPYPLTPGGGEKYILTIAQALSDTHEVSVVCSNIYSQLRLHQLGFALNLDLTNVAVVAHSPTLLSRRWDVAFVLGNSIAPPFSIDARRQFYICQFPFDLARLAGTDIPLAHEFQYVCYSQFVKNNLRRHSSLHDEVIVVLPPVVESFRGNKRKSNVILSVGRFFIGDHCKNQHLLIEAFRRLSKTKKYCDWKLILAGSTKPEPAHREYFRRCADAAAGLNVQILADVSHEALVELYADATVYWHGAGIGVDNEIAPQNLEHFGISPLEAVSAGCQVYVANSGGPAENAKSGTPNMQLFGSIADLETLMMQRSGSSVPSAESHRYILERFGAATFKRQLTELVS